jgi:hypothetical protein
VVARKINRNFVEISERVLHFAELCVSLPEPLLQRPQTHRIVKRRRKKRPPAPNQTFCKLNLSTTVTGNPKGPRNLNRFFRGKEQMSRK